MHCKHELYTDLRQPETGVRIVRMHDQTVPQFYKDLAHRFWVIAARSLIPS